MKMLMALSLLISMVLGYSAHPMLMIALISSQAFILCLILWLIMSNSWFSFILFLVFMGGLMVLFIYVSSLASNEKISLDMWKPKNLITPCFTLLAFCFIYYNSQALKESSLNSSMEMIFKIYSSNMIFITMMTMVYLLLTLIIVVKLISLKEGPMRPVK